MEARRANSWLFIFAVYLLVRLTTMWNSSPTYAWGDTHSPVITVADHGGASLYAPPFSREAARTAVALGANAIAYEVCRARADASWRMTSLCDEPNHSPMLFAEVLSLAHELSVQLMLQLPASPDEALQFAVHVLGSSPSLRVYLSLPAFTQSLGDTFAGLASLLNSTRAAAGSRANISLGIDYRGPPTELAEMLENAAAARPRPADLGHIVIELPAATEAVLRQAARAGVAVFVRCTRPRAMDSIAKMPLAGIVSDYFAQAHAALAAQHRALRQPPPAGER